MRRRDRSSTLKDQLRSGVALSRSFGPFFSFLRRLCSAGADRTEDRWIIREYLRNSVVLLAHTLLVFSGELI